MIDHFLLDIFSYRKLIGVCLVFLGVLLNVLIDKKDTKNNSPHVNVVRAQPKKH